MHVRDDIDLGVSTHTGPVRGANEDDYLILEPGDDEGFEASGRLFILADGMGGTAGGAEASRAAVRALATEFVRDVSGTVDSRLASGFAHAAREVYRASRTTPQLADMGTTLTAMCLHGDEMHIAHVGDTRCVLVRAGALVRLTEDHAIEEPRHLLTRCLGAGRDSEEVDQDVASVQAGDVFALMTDGAWGPLSDEEIARILRNGNAQEAADRIVDAAIEAGGTDNATAIVVRVREAGRTGILREVDLSAEEASLPLVADQLSVAPPRWPWVLLGLALLVLAAAIVELAGGFE